MQVRMASESFLQTPRLLIIGPPKHGKTLLCGTYSQQWAGWNRGRQKSLTVLSDMLWIAFDPGATESLVGQSYDVPCIDRSSATGKDLLPGLNDLEKELPGYVKKNGTRAVVIDSISFLDKYLNEYWGKVVPDPKFSRQKYAAIGETHTRFAALLLSLGTAVFVCAHAKAEASIDASDKDAAARARATNLPGSGGISSQITGQTKSTYEGLVDMILPLEAKTVQGRDADGKPVAVLNRLVYPQGGGGFEGANRFMQHLDTEEPANLQTLFQKIRAGVATEKPEEKKA